MCRSLFVLTLLVLSGAAGLLAQSGDSTPDRVEVAEVASGTRSSPYIPLDSWMYPAAIRLYELGYLPTAFLGMRPWTRTSLAHMLQLTSDAATEEPDSEAAEIFARLERELSPELAVSQRSTATLESSYSRVRAIGGDVLNDSFHAGQSVTNDYGRPFQSGLNNVTGFSVRGTSGRFSGYFRGEYQHAPGAPGYSAATAATLAAIDATPDVPQSTIPLGPLAQVDRLRVLEANISTHLLGNEVSFGKEDAWLGPAQGASMAWSNNAENIYAFHIDRVEPLYIPGLSRLIGFVRYDFFVGTLDGHQFPVHPWIHAEKISFKPVSDVEFGFERSVIWGGEGHVPITVGTFLRSFFSTSGVDPSIKLSRNDPGARFSTFDMTWRIPWRQHLVTIYTDSLVHDNVFPVSNPGRAGFRPGVYVSRLPNLPRVDFRIEAAQTDPDDINSQNGSFLYTESVQKQGYTNNGQIIGDWIGREGKGGQAWLTWHRLPDQALQLTYRMAKVDKDLVPKGTTQQDIGANITWRPWRDWELYGAAQGELWRAPLLAAGTQRNFLTEIRITWFPAGSLRKF